MKTLVDKLCADAVRLTPSPCVKSKRWPGALVYVAKTPVRRAKKWAHVSDALRERVPNLMRSAARRILALEEREAHLIKRVRYLEARMLDACRALNTVER